MKNILVIGSTGQIGSELTMKLRRDLPGGTTVAGYIPGAEPKGKLLTSGPAEIIVGAEVERLGTVLESDLRGLGGSDVAFFLVQTGRFDRSELVAQEFLEIAVHIRFF